MDHDLTLREALQEHLAAEGFRPDGNNSERWVALGLGPLVLCLPNLKLRQRAMLPHDLNHVISGYGHDLIGEAEISAWELGGGCGRYVAAWFMVRAGLVAGLALAPKRMFRAFVRGRRTGNLFSRDFTQLLDFPLTEVRASLGLDKTYDWRWPDALSFVFAAAFAPLAGSVPFAISVLTSPAWLVSGAYRQRRRPTAGVRAHGTTRAAQFDANVAPTWPAPNLPGVCAGLDERMGCS